MTNASRVAPKVRGPAELLQAVPYLLGFVPHDSLVLVGLHDGVLALTARLDLGDVSEDSATVVHTLRTMARAGVTTIIAAVYLDSAAGSRDARSIQRWWTGRADALNARAADVGATVVDFLAVFGQRWLSVWCREPDCCGSDGRPLPAQPSAFAAAATVAGVVALPDRRALEAMFDPAPVAARLAVGKAIESAVRDDARALVEDAGARRARAVKRAIFGAARAAHAPGWSGCPAADTARFAVALRGRDVRDAVWTAVDDGRLDGRPLWRDIARHAAAPDDAAAAFLYGWASWRAGDGASARIAAQHAIGSDPGYGAADLLLAALTQGIDPRTFPRLRKHCA